MISRKCLMGLCGLTAVLGLASGCSDYTYFNVPVYLRISGDNAFDTQSLKNIGRCSVAVFAGDRQIESNTTLYNGGVEACRPGVTFGEPRDLEDPSVRVYDLGVMDYSTARQSGSIKFVVTAKDQDKKLDIAQGEGSADVSPGKVKEAKVIIEVCPKDGCKIKDIE